MSNSVWLQKRISLKPKSRGFHLITDVIIAQLPELKQLEIGLAHLFIQHSSASLAINENADPSVRVDMESGFNKIAPENAPYYTHTFEGEDDMPAHLKTVLIGCDITIPITDGRLAMGIWQGIYLCEHRNYAGARNIVITLTGKGSEI